MISNNRYVQILLSLSLFIVLCNFSLSSFASNTPKYSIPGTSQDQVCTGNTSLDLSRCLAHLNISNQKISTGSDKYNLAIYSNTQEFKQLANNKIYSTFTGNVRIVYQSDIVILANKVIVDQTGSNRIVKAYGYKTNKVQISSAIHNFNLTGTEVLFNLDTNNITANNATAIYNHNSLSGSVITYNVTNNSISARGNSSQQVKTIITNISTNKK